MDRYLIAINDISEHQIEMLKSMYGEKCMIVKESDVNKNKKFEEWKINVDKS